MTETGTVSVSRAWTSSDRKRTSGDRYPVTRVGGGLKLADVEVRGWLAPHGWGNRDVLVKRPRSHRIMDSRTWPAT